MQRSHDNARNRSNSHDDGDTNMLIIYVMATLVYTVTVHVRCVATKTFDSACNNSNDSTIWYTIFE